MPDPIATVIHTRVAIPAHTGAPASAALPVNSVVRPMAADLPPKVDLPEILEDVADDSVSAPKEQVNELVDVVDRAQDHGIDLSIVVLPKDPNRDSQLRDLATEVGVDEGGTVLVLSPSWVGTFSDSISRVQLESGQDQTYTSDSVDAADNFVDELIEPGPPWALMTVVLILIVVAVAAISLFAKLRRATPALDSESRAGAAEPTIAEHSDKSGHFGSDTER